MQPNNGAIRTVESVGLVRTMAKKVNLEPELAEVLGALTALGGTSTVKDVHARMPHLHIRAVRRRLDALVERGLLAEGDPVRRFKRGPAPVAYVVTVGQKSAGARMAKP